MPPEVGFALWILAFFMGWWLGRRDKQAEVEEAVDECLTMLRRAKTRCPSCRERLVGKCPKGCS